MRPVVALGVLAGAVATAACAVLGGFDFSGYSAARDAGQDGASLPDATSSADGPTGTGPDDGAGSIDGAADGADEAAVDADAGGAEGAVDGRVDGSVDVPEAGADAAPSTDASCPNDENNCGACGHGCQGGSCVSGRCQPVVLATATSPVAIVVNESTVYWVDGSNILSAPVGGGPAATFYAGASTLGAGLAIDSTNLYWLEGGAVQTLFLGGGGKYFFDLLPGVGPYALGAFTVDSANLYIARTNVAVQGGGCPTVQIDEVPLSHNGTPSAWTSGVCGLRRITVDGANAYWTDTGTNNSYAHPAVWRQSLDGGAAVQVAPAQNPYGIGAFGGILYWTDTNAGKVMQVAVDGSSSPTPLAAKASSPGDLAVDSSGVYWIDNQSTVFGVARSGGTPRTLATGQAAAQAIAINAASVFWINTGSPVSGGAVMKVAK